MHTDAILLVTEPGHAAQVEPLLGHLPFDADRVLVSRRHPRADDPLVPWGRALDVALDDASLATETDAVPHGSAV